MDDQYTKFAEENYAAMSGEPFVDEQAMQLRLRDAAAPIIQRLERLAADAAQKRKTTEKRWVDDLCQFYGVRSINELVSKSNPLGGGGDEKHAARSTIFVNFTQTKTNRTIGRLNDILFPADDKNWGISPTPRPDLEMVAKRAMEEAQRAVDQANKLQEAPEGEMSPEGMSADELFKMAGDLGPQGADAAKELAEAKKRAERMSTEIDDQLVEARYAQKSRDALEWAGKIGLGILKGPVVMEGGRTAWTKQEGGSFVLAASGESARPTIECVSPWAFFPDPSATSMDDAEFVLERHLPSKKDLRKMARKLGFYEEPLRELLKEGPGEATSDDFQHLKDMRLLTGEDATISGRYVLWEFHGSLESDEIGKLLRAIGETERAEAFEEEHDPFTDNRVIAWFCNGKLLKFTEYYPMDSGDFIYSVYSLERGAASILGAIGLPNIMADMQAMLNAAVRMMMDNAKLSVGPQILIDKSRVVPADNNWLMQPGKEWLWDSANGTAQVPPFQTFDIPMNQDQIAGIIALARSFIDDVTAMPSVIEGGVSEERAPGAAQTLGGFAMLLNAAGVNVRRMVKNWDDDVTTGMIRRLYDWNMQHAVDEEGLPRDEIKGDMQVEARGTSVLLVREMQAQNLMAMAANWTVHPVLAPMLKTYDMARLTLQSMGINPSDLLLEREEFDKKMEALAQQSEPEDPQWMVRKEIAQIDADSRVYVADRQLEADMIRLSETTNVSLEDIRAKLEAKKVETASKERIKAADIAVEDRRANEARAAGTPEADAVGVGVG